MEYNYGMSYDEATQQKMLGIADKCQNKLRVLVNHMPLMDRNKVNFQTVSTNTDNVFPCGQKLHISANILTAKFDAYFPFMQLVRDTKTSILFSAHTHIVSVNETSR